MKPARFTTRAGSTARAIVLQTRRLSGRKRTDQHQRAEDLQNRPEWTVDRCQYMGLWDGAGSDHERRTYHMILSGSVTVRKVKYQGSTLHFNQVGHLYVQLN